MPFVKQLDKKQTDHEQKLILLTSQSKDEFLRQYKMCEGTSAREICLQVLNELERAIEEGNLDTLQKLSNLIEYITGVEDQSTFLDYYNNPKNPIKDTNLVILACKHNKIQILEYLFSSDSIVLDNVCTILPDNEDETHHNAFYYSIRSGNVKLLNTLISKWPGNYFAIHLEKSDEILSRAYAELLLKNVFLPDKIRIFVEHRLINFCFFSNNSKPAQFIKATHSNINDRINLVLENICLLKADYSNAKNIDERFLFIAKFIAQNIHVLKQQLKSTYNRLPWEEIEFCLVSFISSHIKWQEINLFYQTTLDKTKILNYLEKFAKKLKDEQINIEVMDISKLRDIPKLKREKVVAEITSNYPEFENLFYDYQKIRDIHSLKKINNYIELALSADAKEMDGKLIITRTLQMIGEYVKNTLESPKLSNATNELLLLSLPKDTRKIVIDLRNSLSHAYSLSARTKIEENKDINFFIGIQNDIKQIGSVITDILFNNKITTIRLLLKTIVSSENVDEIKEAVKMINNAELDEEISDGFNMMEHRFEKLIEELSNSIPEQTSYEKQLFHKIDNIVNLDKTKLADIRTKYMHGFTSLKVLNIFCERINSNTIRGLKSFVSGVLRNITPRIEPDSLKKIAELSILIFHSARSRIEYESLEEINRIASNIFYIAEFGSGNFKWIEGLREKLNEKDSFFPTCRQKKTKTLTEEKSSYNNHLALKICELKSVLNKNVFNIQFLDNVASYKSNRKLQAVVEMLVLDIMSILEISKRCLENNSFFLDDDFPLLTGKCLRNHLAHDNALVEILLSDPSVSLLLNAKGLTEDKTINKNTIGKSVREDLLKLRDKYERGLVIIRNQEKMFAALEDGNLNDLKSCIKRGADINARNSKLWSSLHFAAKGTSLEVMKFVLDQHFSVPTKDINDQSPLHIAAEYGRTSIVEFLMKEVGFYVDDMASYGKRPLHIAAERGHKDTVEILLKNKANTTTKDIRGFSPLHYAVENNHKDIVEILLQLEINADTNKTSDGSTSLVIAAKNGHLELVNILLQNKANVNAQNDTDGVALHMASLNGYLDIVNTLLLRGADVNSRFALDGCTPLHYAVEYGHQEIVNVLVKHKANVNAVDKTLHNTPLHYAAKFGRKEILTILLNNQANANVVTSEGMTPLHSAVQAAHLEIVIALLEYDVNINAIDKNNASPIHYAVESDHKEVTKLLIKRGAKVNLKNYNNLTPLHLAAIKGHVDVMTLLIKNKANVNAEDNMGSTPLHAAAFMGNKNIIDILIKNKAKVNVRNKGGLTPLYFAALEGHKDAILFLIENKATVNIINDYGISPLHAAVLEGHTDVVNILIKNKADINAKDFLGGTCLHLAAETGNKAIIEILLASGAKIDVMSENNMTALISAVKNNRKEIVEVLIANGANVDAGGGGPLLTAVLDGFKDIVDVLLQNNACIDIKHEENDTPLHLAAIRGHKEIASALIQRGADVNATTNTGITPLHLAAKKGHDEIIKTLIENGADINIKDKKRMTPLDIAVALNRLECVKGFLESKKTSLGVKDGDNCRTLHMAVQERILANIKCLINRGSDTKVGYKDAIEYFLRNGSSINDIDCAGVSLLHYAAMKGQLEVVKYLVSKDSDVEGDERTVQYLLQNKTDINGRDADGRTALHYAVNNGHLGVVNILLRNGADATQLTYKGNTPLHTAVSKGGEEIVEVLLKHVSRDKLYDFVNAKTFTSGTTSLHVAAKKGSFHVVKILLKYGAAYDITNKEGQTSLELSNDQSVSALLRLIDDLFRDISNGNVKVIEKLKAVKSDEFSTVTIARNNQGATLLQVAIINKNNNFASQLIEMLKSSAQT